MCPKSGQVAISLELIYNNHPSFRKHQFRNFCTNFRGSLPAHSHASTLCSSLNPASIFIRSLAYFSEHIRQHISPYSWGEKSSHLNPFRQAFSRFLFLVPTVLCTVLSYLSFIAHLRCMEFLFSTLLFFLSFSSQRHSSHSMAFLSRASVKPTDRLSFLDAPLRLFQ
jgi:hypothetical protein